jgi:hypothetical protein
MKTLDELMGPPDYIWDECELRSRPLDKRNGDVYYVQHHSVSRTLQSILDVFKSKIRSVSANAAVGPLVAGRDEYHVRHTVPWRTHRAYTTSSSIDDKAITNEMANLSLTPPYPVGQSGKQWAAEVVAAMHVELGMPIDRHHVTCHREVYQRGWGSYATACPGDDLHAALDWICEEAKRIVAGGDDAPTQRKDHDMPIVIENVRTGRTYGLGLGFLKHHANVAERDVALLTAGQKEPIKIDDFQFQISLFNHGLEEFAFGDEWGNVIDGPGDGQTWLATWARSEKVDRRGRVVEGAK